MMKVSTVSVASDFGESAAGIGGKRCGALHGLVSFALDRTIAVMPARKASGRSGHAVTSSAKSGHFRAKSAKKHAKFFESDS